MAPSSFPRRFNSHFDGIPLASQLQHAIEMSEPFPLPRGFALNRGCGAVSHPLEDLLTSWTVLMKDVYTTSYRQRRSSIQALVENLIGLFRLLAFYIDRQHHPDFWTNVAADWGLGTVEQVRRIVNFYEERRKDFTMCGQRGTPPQVWRDRLLISLVDYWCQLGNRTFPRFDIKPWGDLRQEWTEIKEKNMQIIFDMSQALSLRYVKAPSTPDRAGRAPKPLPATLAETPAPPVARRVVTGVVMGASNPIAGGSADVNAPQGPPLHSQLAPNGSQNRNVDRADSDGEADIENDGGVAPLVVPKVRKRNQPKNIQTPENSSPSRSASGAKREYDVYDAEDKELLYSIPQASPEMTGQTGHDLSDTSGKTSKEKPKKRRKSAEGDEPISSPLNEEQAIGKGKGKKGKKKAKESNSRSSKGKKPPKNKKKQGKAETAADTVQEQANARLGDHLQDIDPDEAADDSDNDTVVHHELDGGEEGQKPTAIRRASVPNLKIELEEMRRSLYTGGTRLQARLEAETTGIVPSAPGRNQGDTGSLASWHEDVLQQRFRNLETRLGGLERRHDEDSKWARAIGNFLYSANEHNLQTIRDLMANMSTLRRVVDGVIANDESGSEIAGPGELVSRKPCAGKRSGGVKVAEPRKPDASGGLVRKKNKQRQNSKSGRS